MDTKSPHRTEHSVVVDAPAGDVYRQLADVEQWPRLFPPTIHVDRFDTHGDTERIHIWATANGEVKDWISRRVLDPGARSIDFRQEVSAPPVAAMGGTWIVEELSPSRSRIRLRHDFRAIDDDPAHTRWIAEAVDRNSRTELDALKIRLELATGAAGDLLLSFSDTVTIDGAAKDVYDFLNEADLWSERLPHVARVSLTEQTPGLQVLEMDTMTKDGSTHTTKSIRVCFPDHRIVYKQITLPALMSLHTGYWKLTDDEDGVTATSQHTVAIKPDTIAAVLGPDADVAAARQFVRTALSANSLATLGHAKAYAESRR